MGQISCVVCERERGGGREGRRERERERRTDRQTDRQTEHECVCWYLCACVYVCAVQRRLALEMEVKRNEKIQSSFAQSFDSANTKVYNILSESGVCVV